METDPPCFLHSQCLLIVSLQHLLHRTMFLLIRKDAELWFSVRIKLSCFADSLNNKSIQIRELRLFGCFIMVSYTD
jgi:hypothetical protein